MAHTVEAILEKYSLRKTAVRHIVLSFLLQNTYPVAPPAIFKHVTLKKEGVAESTVYRELNTLFEKGVVRKTYLFDEKESYELATRHHHHHVVCVDCNDIQDVESGEVEKVLKKLQDLLEKETIFNNISHHLEFKGVCNNCENA